MLSKSGVWRRILQRCDTADYHELVERLTTSAAPKDIVETTNAVGFNLGPHAQGLHAQRGETQPTVLQRDNSAPPATVRALPASSAPKNADEATRPYAATPTRARDSVSQREDNRGIGDNCDGDGMDCREGGGGVSGDSAGFSEGHGQDSQGHDQDTVDAFALTPSAGVVDNARRGGDDNGSDSLYAADDDDEFAAAMEAAYADEVAQNDHRLDAEQANDDVAVAALLPPSPDTHKRLSRSKSLSRLQSPQSPGRNLGPDLELAALNDDAEGDATDNREQTHEEMTSSAAGAASAAASCPDPDPSPEVPLSAAASGTNSSSALPLLRSSMFDSPEDRLAQVQVSASDV